MIIIIIFVKSLDISQKGCYHKRAMTKFSSRRQAVLDVIRNMRCHPSADMVYEQCRKSIPNISLATVYRNLAFLEQQGIVGRVIGAGEKERYDIQMDSHAHVICKNCGKIVDIPYPENLKDTLDKYVGELNFSSAVLSFYNVCEDCKEQK